MTMMTTFSNKNTMRLAYATMCGAHHKKKHELNQDAYFVRLAHAFSIFCVADGVGSHKYSRKGSRAVVRAVGDVFADFVAGKLERKKLTATIYERFRSKIHQKYHTQASTTCLFIAITEAHGIFLGQVGDGLAVLKINGEAKYISAKDDEFSNVVQPLSPANGNCRWTTHHFDINQDDEIEIFLSTDGISGDVIPGHEEECLDYFLKKISAVKKHRSRELKKILLNWSKNGSNDDKTVIVYRNR